MAATCTWITDDGREFRGESAHITWTTAGAHWVDKRLPDGTTRRITATTTTQPLNEYPVTEYGLHPGLVPTTADVELDEVGGFEADGVTPKRELLPTPNCTIREPIPLSWDRRDPKNRFASDYDPSGLMPWPELLGRMMQGWTKTAAGRCILDHPAPVGQRWWKYREPPTGFNDGRMSCLRIGADYGGTTVWEGTRYSLDTPNRTGIDTTTGVETWRGAIWAEGIYGEGAQALCAPSTVESTRRWEVYPTTAETRADVITKGAVLIGGRYYASPQVMGNVEARGLQHECRVIEVWNPPAGFTIANLAFLPPGGRDDGDVPIRGYNGIDWRYPKDMVVSHLWVEGLGKAWGGFPPGETGQLWIVGLDGRLYYTDSTVSGARPDGTRVAGAPLGFNTTTLAPGSLIARITNTENAHSMETYWNTNGRVRRLDVTTDRANGGDPNFEDAFFTEGSLWENIRPVLDVRSRYDATGEDAAGTVQVSINSGPRALGTHMSRQRWVNWRTVTPGPLEFFNGIPHDGSVMSIQSQLSYQGVAANMVPTGPQSLWMEGVPHPLGIEAWRDGQWQEINANVHEIKSNGELVPPYNAVTMEKPWPSGMGGHGKKVAIFRR